jgi:hypothetical protein
MFNVGSILKRSWKILWSYKILWVFAFLIAITGGAGGSSGGSGFGGSSNYSTRFGQNFTGSNGFNPGGSMPQWTGEFGTWMNQHIVPLFATEQRAFQTVVWMVAGLLVLCILIGLLLSIVRYPSETAVIRMVDEHEQTGTKLRFKQGWKLGWNRRAFRLWVIDLIIGSPALLLVLIVIGMGLLLFYRFQVSAPSAVMPGEVVGIIFLIFFVFAFALFMAVLGLIRQYIIRFAAIDGMGVGESLRRGWGMFKLN